MAQWHNMYDMIQYDWLY